MDEIKSNLDKIRAFMDKSDNDWVHVTVGGEGSGKTTLNAAMALYFDDSFNAGRMHFNGEDLRKQAMELDELSAISHDEAIEDFYSREAMKESNRKMIKFLRKCRFLQLFILLSLPSIRELDKSIRNDRVRSVARVVKPGWVHFYTQNQVEKITFDKDGNTKWPDPAFRDSFPNVKKTNPDFWQSYQEKKKRDISDIGDDGEDGLQPKEMAKVILRQGADPDSSEFVSEYRGRIYVDKDLVGAEFDVGGRKANKAKKIAEKKLGLR